MAKYCILCRNRGMWGGMESYLKLNGKIVVFYDKYDAQKKVDEIRENRGNINNFSDYFVEEVEK